MKQNGERELKKLGTMNETTKQTEMGVTGEKKRRDNCNWQGDGNGNGKANETDQAPKFPPAPLRGSTFDEY